jgi:hypothetical protein
MQIYLPIAEVSVNAFLLLGLGGMVGVLSGMFGVGGGFLMTPLFHWHSPCNSRGHRGEPNRCLIIFRCSGPFSTTHSRF